MINFDTLVPPAPSFQVSGEQFTVRQNVTVHDITRMRELLDAPDADTPQNDVQLYALVVGASQAVALFHAIHRLPVRAIPQTICRIFELAGFGTAIAGDA